MAVISWQRSRTGWIWNDSAVVGPRHKIKSPPMLIPRGSSLSLSFRLLTKEDSISVGLKINPDEYWVKSLTLVKRLLRHGCGASFLGPWHVTLMSWCSICIAYGLTLASRCLLLAPKMLYLHTLESTWCSPMMTSCFGISDLVSIAASPVGAWASVASTADQMSTYSPGRTHSYLRNVVIRDLVTPDAYDFFNLFLSCSDCLNPINR